MNGSLTAPGVRLWVSVGLVLSTFGGWYHNIEEFPTMPQWAPEMLMTIVPGAVLLGWWWLRPGAALMWVTTVWVLLGLIVGAFLSVFPLQVWPFDPEQTADHYRTHLIYAATQVPTLVVLAWLMGRMRR